MEWRRPRRSSANCSSAGRGEEVVITRRGEPVGQLIRPAGAKTGRLASVAELRGALKRQPEQKTAISEDIIAMRRDARH